MRTGAAQMKTYSARIPEHDCTDADEFVTEGSTSRMRHTSVVLCRVSDVIE